MSVATSYCDEIHDFDSLICIHSQLFKNHSPLMRCALVCYLQIQYQTLAPVTLSGGMDITQYCPIRLEHLGPRFI